MKKIISVVLALVMMMAVMVPAFAANEVVNTEGVVGNTTDVVTTTKDKDGNDAYSYTVTIPATISVAWNDTETEYPAGYKVTSQLLIGATLKVNVAYDLDTDDTNNGVMVAEGTDKTLTYTLAGDGVGVNTFSGVNNNVETKAHITVAGFADAPIGAYTGTITYAVEYSEN